jgi:glycosyltransferase involved in cell wall biosynthesis
MLRLIVPDNIKKHNFHYQRLKEVPEEIFKQIRHGFTKQKTEIPFVSVDIIARNEESNILRNLSSLSCLQSSYPIEFVFVDNNSTDQTAEIIRKCGVTPVLELRQGYGFARQAAIEHSHGKYVITGDADTIYPPTWIDEMLKPILTGKGIAAYGTYSFIPNQGQKRFRFAFYEFFRDLVHRLRCINRPELCVGGVNFCFIRELALSIGFIQSSERMEDGQMAFAMSRHGSLVRVGGGKSRVWTVPRSIENKSSFFVAIASRIVKEIKRIKLYFYKYDN